MSGLEPVDQYVWYIINEWGNSQMFFNEQQAKDNRRSPDRLWKVHLTQWQEVLGL